MARRGKIRYGVYEHRKTKHRVVVLDTPDRVWLQYQGTNIPAVLIRTFNQPENVKIAIADNAFRADYVWVGRYTTQVTHVEVLRP